MDAERLRQVRALVAEAERKLEGTHATIGERDAIIRDLIGLLTEERRDAERCRQAVEALSEQHAAIRRELDAAEDHAEYLRTMFG